MSNNYVRCLTDHKAIRVDLDIKLRQGLNEREEAKAIPSSVANRDLVNGLKQGTIRQLARDEVTIKCALESRSGILL